MSSDSSNLLRFDDESNIPFLQVTTKLTIETGNPTAGGYIADAELALEAAAAAATAAALAAATK